MLDEIVRKRLPRSVPTRWNFQSRSVNTVFLYREQIIKCMRDILSGDQIRNFNTIYQANGFIKTLTSNTFVFWLSFFHKVMPHVEILFGSLQKVDINPLTAENTSLLLRIMYKKSEKKLMKKAQKQNQIPQQKKEMSRQ